MTQPGSKYGPVWEQLKERKTAKLKFPDDELNIALAISRTKKAVINLKDSDIGFKALSDMPYRLKIKVDLKARTLEFNLIPCIKKAISWDL